MDNQAFCSSRDSNMSNNEASLGTLQRNNHANLYDNALIFQQQVHPENGIEAISKEAETQKRLQAIKPRDENKIEKYLPYTEIPLIEALQNKTILVQASPVARKSSNNERKHSGQTKRAEAPRYDEESCRKRSDRPDSPVHTSTNNDDSTQNGNMIGLPFPPNDSPQIQRCLRQNTASQQYVSRAVQVWPTPPYRLRVLPRSKYTGESKVSLFAYIGRCIFCQLGLSTFLLMWIAAGAASFHFTEGPAEVRMEAEQRDLVANLVLELKQSPEATWHRTIERYVYKQEIACSEEDADMSDGTPGKVWSFPGCTLFAISLITTLGFGAPVPRTSEGRAVAVIFAAVGIPLHLILVLNIGMVVAVKLQKFATRKSKREEEEASEENDEVSRNDRFIDITQNNRIVSRHRRSGSEPIGRQAISNITREANFMIGEGRDHKYQHISEGDANAGDKEFKTSINNFLPVKKHESTYDICAFKSLENLTKEEKKIYKDIGSQPLQMPVWLKWLPFIGIAIYYTTGVLVFGFGRGQRFLDSLMFPLDFTVAGGVAHTEGHIRVLYGIYLEGAVVIAATTVSILQVTATKGFTDLGLRYGLLTNSR